MSLHALANLLRAFPVMQRLARKKHPPFFEQRFASRAAHVRHDFLVERARGKRVLHFGFVDHPLSEEKLASGQLLHSKLMKTSPFVYGLDVDGPALEVYRRLTGDRNNGLLDVEGEEPGPDLALGFEVILFSEILEHLRNPGRALERLRRVAEANPGAEVIVTTPNALSLKTMVPALSGTELVHPEHYAYFSPHTLKHLLESSGFGDVELAFYWEASTLGRKVPGIAHEGVIATCRPAQPR